MFGPKCSRLQIRKVSLCSKQPSLMVLDMTITILNICNPIDAKFVGTSYYWFPCSSRFRYQTELPKKIKARGKEAHLIHDELVQTIKWKLAVRLEPTSTCDPALTPPTHFFPNNIHTQTVSFYTRKKHNVHYIHYFLCYFLFFLYFMTNPFCSEGNSKRTWWI